MATPLSMADRDSIVRLSEAAVASAVQHLCGSSTWRGVARELGWRAVIAGGCELRLLESLCDIAEARFASLIEDAIWTAERSALRGWQEYLETRPDDQKGALTAATLDAREDATRAIADACSTVLGSLIADNTIARPTGRRLRPWRQGSRSPESLAA